MGPRALAASSGLAPWSIAMNINSCKKTVVWEGVKGACPVGLIEQSSGLRNREDAEHLRCFPLWGREGVTLVMYLKKNDR